MNRTRLNAASGHFGLPIALGTAILLLATPVTTAARADWIAPNYPKAVKIQVREHGAGTYRYYWVESPTVIEYPTNDRVSADFSWRSRFGKLKLSHYPGYHTVRDSRWVAGSAASGSWSFGTTGFDDAYVYGACNHAGTVTGTMRDASSLSGGVEGVLTRRGLKLVVDPGGFVVDDPGSRQESCYLERDWGLNNLFTQFSDLVLDCSQALFDFCPAGATAAFLFVPADELKRHKRLVLDVANTDQPSLTPAADCAEGFLDTTCAQSFAWNAELTLVQSRGKAPGPRSAARR